MTRFIANFLLLFSARRRDYGRDRDAGRDRDRTERGNFGARDRERKPEFKEWDVKCKVYIGNLSPQTTKNEVEKAFNRYGELKNVWVARNPPGK